MKVIVDLLIVAFWIYLLVDAALQGRELPGLISELELPKLPVGLAVSVVLLGSCACGIVTFWQRRNIMEDMPLLSTAFDRVFGKDAYGRFTKRLRPIAASIVSSAILATVGGYTTLTSTKDEWSLVLCFGFGAFSICMFTAYLASRRYPPLLR